MKTLPEFLKLARAAASGTPLLKREEPTLVLEPARNVHLKLVEPAKAASDKIGDCNLWLVICQESSLADGWVKTTRAMTTGAGCVLQVSTQQLNKNGSYSLAEAVTYVPNVSIVKDIDGGNRLHPNSPFK